MWRYFEEQRPATLDALRRLYEKWQRGSPTEREVWMNWLCRERSSGKLIGAMQATVFTQQAYSLVAYAVYPQYQRKGYAREAIQAVIEYVSTTYGIKRFVAEMDKRNEASYRLAESLGFARIETGRTEYVYELKV